MLVTLSHLIQAPLQTSMEVLIKDDNWGDIPDILDLQKNGVGTAPDPLSRRNQELIVFQIHNVDGSYVEVSPETNGIRCTDGISNESALADDNAIDDDPDHLRSLQQEAAVECLSEQTIQYDDSQHVDQCTTSGPNRESLAISTEHSDKGKETCLESPTSTGSSQYFSVGESDADAPKTMANSQVMLTFDQLGDYSRSTYSERATPTRDDCLKLNFVDFVNWHWRRKGSNFKLE